MMNVLTIEHLHSLWKQPCRTMLSCSLGLLLSLGAYQAGAQTLTVKPDNELTKDEVPTEQLDGFDADYQLITEFPLPQLVSDTMVVNDQWQYHEYLKVAEDLAIPESALGETLYLRVHGGDGGGGVATIVGAEGHCREYKRGGAGGEIHVSVPIGFDDGQLAPGSVVRFIVGGGGKKVVADGSARGEAGGGTAVVYKPVSMKSIRGANESPYAVADHWKLLAVAGGGGASESEASILNNLVGEKYCASGTKGSDGVDYVTGDDYCGTSCNGTNGALDSGWGFSGASGNNGGGYQLPTGSHKGGIGYYTQALDITTEIITVPDQSDDVAHGRVDYRIGGGVTVSQDCNYGGYSRTLGLGSYTQTNLIALDIRNNDVSSIQVQAGYEAVLYEYDDFGGKSIVLTSDDACLADNGFNDTVSSIKIRRIGNPIRAAQNTGKCLHKKDADTNNGNPIHLWSQCDDANNQNKGWIYEAKTGYIRLASDPTKCLHKKDANWNSGNVIHLWDCFSGSVNDDYRANKIWTYDETTHYIRARNNPNQCIHKQDDNWNNGNVIHLWSCDDGPAENKTWVMDASL